MSQAIPTSVQKVKFNPVTIAYLPSESLNVVSLKEFWMSSRERKNIELEIRVTVNRYRKAKRDNEPFREEGKYCLRGIEDRLSNGAILCRKAQKFHYVRGVLREQLRRRRENLTPEPFLVGPSLLSTSNWATNNALKAAAQDTVEASRCHESPPILFLDLSAPEVESMLPTMLEASMTFMGSSGSSNSKLQENPAIIRSHNRTRSNNHRKSAVALSA